MKKIHGFTLAEMMVAMLLTLLVVAMSYTGYMIISKTSDRMMGSVRKSNNLYVVNQIVMNQVETAYPFRALRTNMITQLTSPPLLMLLQDSGICFLQQDSFFVYLPSSFSMTNFQDTLLKETYIETFSLNIKRGDTIFKLNYSPEYAADFFMNNSKY